MKAHRTSLQAKFFLLLGMLLNNTVSAQFEEKNFIRYSVRDGLCDNFIKCIQQDAQGYIWLGTDAGLNRFDGHTFRKYHQGTSPLRLPSGNIARLRRFGNDLGIITKGGLVILDGSTYSAQVMRIPDSTAYGTHVNAGWDAMSTLDSAYVFTSATGVYFFDHKGDVRFRHDAYVPEDIGTRRLLYARDIFEVGSVYIIYIEEEGVALYDPKEGTLTEVTGTETNWAPFVHPETNGNTHWVVKQQLSDNLFAFIPNHEDVIVIYDHATKQKVTSALPFETEEAFNWESVMTLVNDSTLAVNGRANGFYLLHLDPKTNKITCDREILLPNYKILSHFVDAEGRHWIGTTEGLLMQRLHPQLVQAFHYPPDPGETYTGGFVGTYRHQDILYACRYSNTEGLTLINAKTMQRIKDITFYTEKSAWNEIRSVEMYYPDTLWLGTNAGLLWFDTKSETYGPVLDAKTTPWSLEFYPILAPVRPDGNAWMCSFLNGMIIRYHVPTRKFTVFDAQSDPPVPFARIKSIAYDAYGDVWFGGHALARWSEEKQLFDTLISVYAGPNKYSDDIVALVADSTGSLWLHNALNGILEYQIREKQFISYTTDQGLPTNLFNSLSPVRENTLWIASNNYLVHMNTRDKQFTIYDHADGLPEARPTGRRIQYDPVSESMLVSSTEYILKFPATVTERSTAKRDLILEWISMDEDKTVYRPGAEFVLRPSQKNLHLQYSVIDFDKSNYQFAYRIQQDANWQSIGTQRALHITNLAPGSYVVEVRATGGPGVELRHTLNLEVLAPVWKRPWFLALSALFILFLIWVSYRHRMRAIRKKAELDHRMLQSEMKLLQSQMNPHFIFNSLNSIGEMILNQENKDASHYLSKFARLIRMTLEQSVQSQVSLRNALDYLERYIEMEHIRNGQFTYTIKVDPALHPDETMIPPMVLQPFVENALWHGVTTARKDIHVRIDLEKVNGFLQCTIEDDGAGLKHAEAKKTNFGNGHQSIGIQNIQHRIALLNEKYRMHGRVSIKDKEEIPGSKGTGTVVTLQIPLEYEES